MSNERERLARQWAVDCQGEGKLPAYGIAAQAAADHILATTTEPTMDEVEWNEDTHALTGAVVDVGSGPVDVVMLAGSVDGIDYATLDGKFGYEPRYYFTPNGKRYELCEVTDKPEHPVEPSTKTMDEYTMAERADMVGMWAGYNRHRLGGEPTDFVIITGEENEAGRVPCYNPGAPAPHAWASDSWVLTPRFDMPRAWSTDGDPCAPTVSSNENVRADQPEHPETLTTWEDFDNAPEGTVVSSPGAVPAMKNRDGRWRAVGITTPLTSGSLALGAESPATVLRWGWGE